MKSTAAHPRRTPAERAAAEVLQFWFEELKPADWFRRSLQIDATINARFGAAHAAASNEELEHWRVSPRPALALIILLDQFSRNLGRDRAEAFAHDPQAREVAIDAIRRRFDMAFDQKHRAFFYLPLMHSEEIADQETSERLHATRLASTVHVHHARVHADIIRQYGRFPHRNHLLGRESTPAERQFLKNGGFRG